MDVRETTELDEDERIITIADGSDTGIVNAQVPEADIIRYKDSTYEIISKIAYLIGVPKRILRMSTSRRKWKFMNGLNRTRRLG